jgi:enterobacterial common antigen flippase
LKALIKNTGIAGSGEFLLIAVSIIRNKYLALAIGPAGFGLFSLLQSFFDMATMLGGFWSATACLKYISEYNKKNDRETVKLIFDMSFFFIFLLSSVVAVLLIIFFHPIRILFLTEEVFFSYYALFSAYYLGTSTSIVFQTLLQGLIDIKSIVKVKIMTSVISLVSVVILVYLFDTLGYFINVGFIALFTCFLLFLQTKKHIKLTFRLPNLKANITKKIFNFSLIDVFLGVIRLIANYLQRILVLNTLNIAALGLYYAANGITKYLALIGTSSMYYFKPQMSAELTVSERNKSLNDYFRLIILTGIMGSMALILFSDEMIHIFYSKDFSKLSPVLIIFVIATFFQTIQLGYLFTTVGMAKLKTHAVASVVEAVSVVIFPYFFLKSIGIAALGLGVLVAALLHILVNASYLKTRQGVYMSFSNFFYVITGVGLMFLSYVFIGKPFLFKVLIITFGFAFVAINIKKNEWQKIYSLVKSKMKR